MCSGDLKSILLLIIVPVISVLVAIYLSCVTRRKPRPNKASATRRMNSRDTFDLRDKRMSEEKEGKLRQGAKGEPYASGLGEHHSERDVYSDSEELEQVGNSQAQQKGKQPNHSIQEEEDSCEIVSKSFAGETRGKGESVR